MNPLKNLPTKTRLMRSKLQMRRGKCHFLLSCVWSMKTIFKYHANCKQVKHWYEKQILNLSDKFVKFQRRLFCKLIRQRFFANENWSLVLRDLPFPPKSNKPLTCIQIRFLMPQNRVLSPQTGNEFLTLKQQHTKKEGYTLWENGLNK